MQIPFHKPYITEDEVSGLLDTVRSGWLTMGPKTFEFEREFSGYVGSEHAVALNSGTSALHLSLKVIGLEAGDEVIVPTMTFTATAEVVCYFNAVPVLVDIDKETGNIDPAAIEKAISVKTRAVIPVHYGGLPCDMDKIQDIAQKRGLYVIEDAAHSLPAYYKGKTIGTIGDLTCFSFYATKPLAAGEGGMVTTENEEWAERMRILRLHGISKDAWKRYSNGGSWYYEVMEAGYKYNMTDIQASIGLSQLKKLDKMWGMRKRIAELYDKGFSDYEPLLTPVEISDRVSSYHLYPLKLNTEALGVDRAEFIEKLQEQGIGTSVHFIPLHRQPFYKNKFSYSTADFPQAEWVYERIVSLPVYPGMSDGEVQYVIQTVKDVCEKHRR